MDVTFATGLVVGIVAAVFVGFLVFKARVIEGTAHTRLPDLRMVIAVAALVVAIVALVRSGHTDAASNTAPSSASSPTSTSPEPSTSSVSSSSSSTTSSVLSTVIVPNLVGLSQTAAVAELQNRGLKSKVESLPLSNGTPPGFVITQTPVALSTTTTGAVVMLGVSGGP